LSKLISNLSNERKDSSSSITSAGEETRRQTRLAIGSVSSDNVENSRFFIFGGYCNQVKTSCSSRMNE
jgi:hypothetical protein